MKKQVEWPNDHIRNRFTQWQLGLLTVVILGINFIGALNNSVIQIALPNLSSEIGVRYETLSIIISVYWLSAGIVALPSGKLGDMYSPKKVFIWGLGIFAFASILCAFTSSYLIITVLRALQGIGVSIAVVNGVSLLRIIYPTSQIDTAMGYWAASISLGYVLGPSVGGFLVEEIGWRLTFAISGLLITLFLGIALWLLPSTNAENVTFDYQGASLLTVMIITLLLVISPLQEESWGWVTTTSLLFIFVASSYWFFKHENNVQEPLINLSTFTQNRQFQMSILSGATYSASMQGLIFGLQYYLQAAQHYSPSQSGSFWMVMSISNLIASLLVGKLSKVTGTRRLAIIGTAIRCLAFAALVILTLSSPNQNLSFFIVVIMLLFGIGMGTTSAPLYSLVVGTFEQKDTGTIAGTYNTIRHISSSIGVAIFSQSLLGLSILPAVSNASNLSLAFILAFIIAFLGMIFLWLIPKQNLSFSTAS